MRKNFVYAFLVLLGLSGFVVLGNSRAVAGFFESVISYPNIFNSSNVDIGTIFSEDDRIGIQLNDGEIIPSLANPDSSSGEIPDFILWQAIFGLPKQLTAAAGKARAEGKPESIFTSYFTRQAGMSAENAEIFRQKAAEYDAAVAPIAERVKAIANHRKAAREAGRRLATEELSSLKKELLELQERRKNAALDHMRKLRDSVGESAFSAFEQWLKTEFAEKFSSWKATSADFSPNDPVKKKPGGNGFESAQSLHKEENQQ